MLQPVRDHFKTNSRAKNLLKQVKVIKISFIMLQVSSVSYSTSFWTFVCSL